MKKLTKALLCGLIFTLLFNSLTLYADCAEIQKSTFRLHIMANSDKAYDQELKLSLRDELLKHTENLYNGLNTLDEIKSVSYDNLAEIESFAQEYIRKQGYNYSVKAEITNMYFTTREYEQFTLPAGNYDALRIVIGEGKGHNWWCVMFPQLCLPGAENKNSIDENYDDSQSDLIKNGTKYRYKFKIVEWYESLCNIFA